MMTRSHRIAFLKVLAAMAWADGVVEEEERNRIKVLFNGFELDEGDRKEVDALLERPVGLDEAVELTKDFAGHASLPGARRQLLDEIEAMLGDDGTRTEDEREVLSHVQAVLSSHTVLDGLAEKLRGMFTGTLLRRREEETGEGEDRDRNFLRAVLDDRPGRDSDLQRICADYCRHATMEDRLEVLDAMFRHALKDDQRIDKREAEHIHRVANLLWISHPEYFSVRDRYRDRIET